MPNTRKSISKKPGKARERFYEEHKSEVDEFRYAYRYLMKHGAEKDGSALSIDLGKLAEEEAQLNARISKADAQINEIASDLSQLRQIRYYLGKVMPEPEEIREVVRTDPDRTGRTAMSLTSLRGCSTSGPKRLRKSWLRILGSNTRKASRRAGGAGDERRIKRNLQSRSMKLTGCSTSGSQTTTSR